MKEPLYIKTCNTIRSQIKSGTLQYGQSLPSERELAETFHIDRKTLRKAISILIDEGLLIRLQGKGTYIAQQQLKYDVQLMDDLGQLLNRNHVKPTSSILYKELRPAGLRFSKLLGIHHEDKVLRLVRMRLGDNEPVALQDTYIVYDIIPNLDSIDFEMYSLYSVLENNNIKIFKIEETFTFIQLSNPEARLLNMEEGAMGFIAEDITYDTSGRAIEYTKGIINNQKLSINVDLKYTP